MKTLGRRNFGNSWLVEWSGSCSCGMYSRGMHVHVTGQSGRTYVITPTKGFSAEACQNVPRYVQNYALVKLRKLLQYLTAV
jgi:hypothetical protein